MRFLSFPGDPCQLHEGVVRDRPHLFHAHGLHLPHHLPGRQWGSADTECLADPEDAATHEVPQSHATAQSVQTHEICDPVGRCEFACIYHPHPHPRHLLVSFNFYRHKTVRLSSAQFGLVLNWSILVRD